MTDMSRELQLLFAAARVELDPTERTRLAAAVDAGVDWSAFERSATGHGVAALVYRTLTETTVVPPAVTLTAIRERFFASSANSLLLSRELLEILARFEEVRVPSIAYKGPALGASLYGHPALRECTDLDVVVPARHVVQAREALLRLGYQDQYALSPADVRTLIDSPSEYFLRFDRLQRAGRVALELHWRIPATFTFDDTYWNRLTPVRLLDGRAMTFAPEDLVLVLCSHGFKHGWSQLRWLCDIHELVRRSATLDWSVAIERARRVGGLRVLLVGCALARSVFGGALPPTLDAAIDADDDASAMAARFHRRLRQPNSRAGVVANLRIRERTGDRVRYGLALVNRLTRPTLEQRRQRPTFPGAGAIWVLAHPFLIAAQVVRKHRGGPQ